MTYHLLPNNILTPLLSHPHLVYPPRLNVNPIAHRIRCFLRVWLVRVSDSERAAENEVGRQIFMGVGRVVCVATGESDLREKDNRGRKEGVPAIGPSKNVREAPGTD